MNRVLIIASLFAVALASTFTAPAYAYAGTTKVAAAGTLVEPAWDATGNCTAGTGTAVSYQMFPLNITTAGVYNFAGMAEDAFKDDLAIYLYMGTFTSATPCAGLVGLKLSNFVVAQGGPVINEGRYLAVGVYTVVITGATGGIFAVNVFSSAASASSLASTTTWSPPSNDQTDPCTASSTTGVHYVSHTFTPSATGQYDIYIYADNGTFVSESGSTSFATAAALYMGSSVRFDALNTTCGANGGVIVSASASSSQAIILQNVTLMAGMPYTVVASGSEVAETAYFGFSVRNSIVFTTEGSSLFTIASHSTSGTCTASTNEVHYFAFTFTAQYPTYILDTQRAFGVNFDTWSYLYAGTWDRGTNPPPCPVVYQGDTGDITPLAVEGLTLGQNYTIFVTPFDQSETTAGPFALYFFTGNQLGGNFTMGGNTGGNTGMNPDTNAVNTNAVDTNAINTNMNTNINTNVFPGATTSPRNSAVALFAGLAAIILALF